MKDLNVWITQWYLALQPFKLKVLSRLEAQMVIANYAASSGLRLCWKGEAVQWARRQFHEGWQSSWD